MTNVPQFKVVSPPDILGALNTLVNKVNDLTDVVGGGGVLPTRLISTTAPLTGGGDLSADRTIVIPAASLTNTQFAAGAVAANLGSFSGDATGTPPAIILNTVNSNVGAFGDAATAITLTVNSKGLVTAAVASAIAIAQSAVTGLVTALAALAPTSRLISTTAPLAGGGDLSADRTLTLTTSPTGQTPVGVTRNINTSAPLAGGGALSSDLTLTIAAATDSLPGSMSAADKTKLDGIVRVATSNNANTTTTTETVVLQIPIPANSLRVGSVFSYRMSYRPSVNTIITCRVRIGSTGTTSDAAVTLMSVTAAMATTTRNTHGITGVQVTGANATHEGTGSEQQATVTTTNNITTTSGTFDSTVSNYVSVTLQNTSSATTTVFAGLLEMVI